MPISPNFSTISYVAARSVCLLGVVARCTQYRRPSLLASGFSKASVAIIPAQRRPHGSTLPSLNRKVWAAWRCASGTMAICSRPLLSFVSLKLTGTTDVCVVKFVKNKRHYHRVVGYQQSRPSLNHISVCLQTRTPTRPPGIRRQCVGIQQHPKTMQPLHLANYVGLTSCPTITKIWWVLSMLQNSHPCASSVFHMVRYMQPPSYPILRWLVTCNKGEALDMAEEWPVFHGFSINPQHSCTTKTD